MKTKRFLYPALTFALTLALVCGLFTAIPMTASAANATALKTVIESFNHGGTGALTAVVSGNTVTVSGNVTGVTNRLDLSISSGVTVVWRADYSGAPEYEMFYLGGAGTFEVAAGSITNMNPDAAHTFYAFNDGFTFNVSGGVMSGAGDVIYIAGGNCSVNVSGGRILSTKRCGIYITGKNGSITVSGGTVMTTFDDYPIYRAIYVHEASTGTTVNVTGGLVFSYDKQNTGVIRMNNGITPVIGGTAVICAWVRPDGAPAYTEGSTTNLVVSPSGAFAKWGLESSAGGIEYGNGANTGFVRIPEATVIATATPGTDGPFRVTEHPVGATYTLNQAAVPLRATFEYDALAQSGDIDSSTPIKAQWYWSLENSNTGRSNGFGESTVEYNRKIIYTTTLTPATDTVGVRYYYAVLTYADSQRVPKEAVTNPARIEVIALTTGTGTLNLTVKKTDENGAPLAGATVRVEGLNESGIPRVYDVVTNSKGEAAFTLEGGEYKISEYAAPAGYNATDNTYNIIVSDRIYIYDPQNPNAMKPYETVTFVNKQIPRLNDYDHFAYMQGYPDGTFGAGRNMTRAEAVVMFARLLAERMNESKDYRYNCYPDVDYLNPSMNQPWYANQVCFMCNKGVLADYSRDERFRPGDDVTRAEFATLAAHFDDFILIDTNKFTDVPNSHWAVKYINSAAAKGWITGYPDDTFKPEAKITRAEVVTLVNRMLSRTADSAYLAAKVSSLPRTYSDLATGHWAYPAIMEASTGHDYTKDSAGEHWTAVYK